MTSASVDGVNHRLKTEKNVRVGLESRTGSSGNGVWNDTGHTRQRGTIPGRDTRSVLGEDRQVLFSREDGQ
jgi:hypothetical protein